LHVRQFFHEPITSDRTPARARARLKCAVRDGSLMRLGCRTGPEVSLQQCSSCILNYALLLTSYLQSWFSVFADGEQSYKVTRQYAWSYNAVVCLLWLSGWQRDSASLLSGSL
jgi:hypothetical protein